MLALTEEGGALRVMPLAATVPLRFLVLNRAGEKAGGWRLAIEQVPGISRDDFLEAVHDGAAEEVQDRLISLYDLNAFIDLSQEPSEPQESLES